MLSDFAALDGQAQAYAEADALHVAAHKFMESETLDMKLWPRYIPLPRDIMSAPTEDQFVNDLVHHAVAFFYLHELRHFVLAQAAESTFSAYDEELECDRWAASYLLDKATQYQPTPPVEPKLIHSKRAMGVTLGAAVISHVQTSGLWESGKQHPPVAERLFRLSKDWELGLEHYFWNVACCFVLSSLRRKNAIPERIEFHDQRDLFNKLLRM